MIVPTGTIAAPQPKPKKPPSKNPNVSKKSPPPLYPTYIRKPVSPKKPKNNASQPSTVSKPAKKPVPK